MIDTFKGFRRFIETEALALSSYRLLTGVFYAGGFIFWLFIYYYIGYGTIPYIKKSSATNRLYIF